MSAAIKFQVLGGTAQQRAVLLVREMCAAAGGARGLARKAYHFSSTPPASR